MPHQCTNCGHTFPDGSKEMLSGCPECGGNKFQFKPAGSNTESVADQSTTDSATPAVTEADSATSTVSQTDASTGVSATPNAERPSAGRQTSPPETEGVGGDAEVVDSEGADSSTESPAQSTARSDVVDASELTAAGSMGPQSETTDESEVDAEDSASQLAADQSATEYPDADRSEESNLDRLRKELNDQFESIRIVSPGQYELNLMELYDREEYIISLREDGRYVIEVPDGWGDS